MFKELSKLKSVKNISKNALMEILQDLAKKISVHDLILATIILREDGKNIQSGYREKYLEIYIKYFIMRVKDIRGDKKDYNGEINNKEYFSEAISSLEYQFHDKKLNCHDNDKVSLIYTIICLYTIFILNEPIHPIGTPFPGGLSVTYENEAYFCPVKDKQSKNPQAMCKFCISEQSDI
jgi:uncharacterized protein (UPF0305 family)